MSLSPFQKSVLIDLVRSRIDGASHYLTHDQLGERLGKPAASVAAALDAVGDWCRESGLPDLSAIAVSTENAERMRMLPADAAVERLGGEVAARAEADRVRDFDWRGWLDA